MRLQPLFGWWLFLPFVMAGVSLAAWHIYIRYKKHHVIDYRWLRRAGLLILLACMLLGVSVPGGTSSPGVANLDVVFAVDTTASMGAEDFAGGNGKLRFDGAKQDMQAIGNRLKGAHFAIITFDSKADVLLPFTADFATFSGAVQDMTRELYNTSNGSSIDKPLEQITQQLKNSKSLYPDRKRLVYYLGDGEQTNRDKVRPFAALSSMLDGGAVLGYGTAQGSRMVKYTGLESRASGNGTSSYVLTPDATTKQFVPAVSKLDESALRQISSQLKAEYFNRNKGGTVDELLQGSKAQLLVDRSRHVTHYLNIYWLFAVPFTLILLWEWQRIILMVVALRQSRREDERA